MGKPSIMFPKYFFKNAPPFKGRTHLRAKTPNKPHFQEKYFPPFARESRNLIIPDKIACFRKHTSKDLSAHTPSPFSLLSRST